MPAVQKESLRNWSTVYDKRHLQVFLCQVSYQGYVKQLHLELARTYTWRYGLNSLGRLPSLELFNSFSYDLRLPMEDNSLLALISGSFPSFCYHDAHIMDGNILVKVPFFEFLFPFAHTVLKL